MACVYGPIAVATCTVVLGAVAITVLATDVILGYGIYEYLDTISIFASLTEIL